MKFNKPTLMTITAPTCSGKTYLIEHLENLGFNRIVGFTTRAPRAGEIDGVHYYFITHDEADRLERDGLLAETATFRGNRYGVTHAEMAGKMDGEFPPVIILEPQGLESYEVYCREQGWNIFKIFVSVTEQVRIDRLNQRTSQDLMQAMFDSSTVASDSTAKIIKSHSDRLMSITGEERLWQSKNSWNAIVPGDDLNKAISFIEQGIKWQNAPKGAPDQSSPNDGQTTFAPDLQHHVLTCFMRAT